MRARQRVAIGNRQVVYRLQSTLGKISLHGIVGGREAGVGSIGSQEVHHACTLHNSSKITEFVVALQILTHHLTLEGKEIR